MKDKQLFKKLYDYIMKSDTRVSTATEKDFYLGTLNFLINVSHDKNLGLYPFNDTYVKGLNGLGDSININSMNLESVSLIRIEKNTEAKKTLYAFRHEDGTEIYADEKFFNLIPFKNVRYMVDTTKGIKKHNPIFVLDGFNDNLIAYILPFVAK
jgi:hypothetical protein|nr:MAG TPA: hypothetical protein [Caudoviricetes sp.]